MRFKILTAHTPPSKQKIVVPPNFSTAKTSLYSTTDEPSPLVVIQAWFVNLPVFVGLLKKAEEEFGFWCSGGLVLPCEVGFFKEILRFIERDESKFGRLGLEEFLKMVSEVGFDSCKELASNAGANSSCHAFTPLLQKARA
ncbi:Hypothetical predicted protein [Prunus dulcis]|uniref:SAUR-like auxin-responsive protein family n=1 Tax=Prunus dulcis TaxID=3755 RepID=A0A5E4FDD2_PRUDU|nr:Hypothetical predicted protein [Prunus dulcis]